MSCYINLLRGSTNTRHLCRNNRLFSLIDQNSSNVISRKNGTSLILKRFKSNDSVNNKTAEAAKAQKVNIRVSDLRRLLSLAKKEKWKITGKLRKFPWSFLIFAWSLFRCDRMSRSVIINNHGRSFWIGQNTRHYLLQ